MRLVTYSTHAHNAKVGRYAYLRWYADWLGRGPHGRRHDRKVNAFMLGWHHQQNETECGDDPSPCPWTKRTYVRQYDAGRMECWKINGGKRPERDAKGGK